MITSTQADIQTKPFLKEIVVIGPLPPPVHGFAQATLDVLNQFQENFDCRVVAIDLKPRQGLRQRLLTPLLRFSELVRVWRLARRGASVYLGLSGGLRQAIDILFLSVARLAGAKTYIHHHSFAYIDQPTRLTRWCTQVCGSSAVHIALCEGMGQLLKKKFPAIQNTAILSNAGLSSVQIPFRQRHQVLSIGYLSALTSEKGILRFLEVAVSLLRNHPELSFRIAGPCRDKSVQAQVNAMQQTWPQIHYVGPVYGETKKQFLDSLDVLLFPTAYANEAEPLVIWEALSSGIPVVAWERGCILEILSDKQCNTFVISRNDDFIQKTIAQLTRWRSSADIYESASSQARAKFENASNKAQRTFVELFGHLTPKEHLRIQTVNIEYQPDKFD